jgi:hypothetical protein
MWRGHRSGQGTQHAHTRSCVEHRPPSRAITAKMCQLGFHKEECFPVGCLSAATRAHLIRAAESPRRASVAPTLGGHLRLSVAEQRISKCRSLPDTRFAPPLS